MKNLAVLCVAAVVAALMASSALAEVVFVPADGTGSVEKGDIQDAFHWNNTTLQANASGLTFKYIAVATYDVTVEWETGPTLNVTHHTITQTIETGVSGVVLHSIQKNKQDVITGFPLIGYDGDPTISGDAIPVVGSILVDPQNDPANNPTDHVVTAVELVSSTGGGLYANYGEQSLLIWQPEAPVVP